MSDWLNHVHISATASGTTVTGDPTNGTGGGTVRNGSAFTPTSGNLLLVVFEASATCTTPSGWTLPTSGSAVNNGGLYVFWRTATSGSNAWTATTNGSGFPYQVSFFEFPAGSTFTSSAAATGVAITGGNTPTLSSLTGTHWIGVAGGQNSGTGSNTTAWSRGTKVDGFSTAVTNGSTLTIGEFNADASTSEFGTFSLSPGFSSTCEALTFAVSVAAAAAADTSSSVPWGQEQLPMYQQSSGIMGLLAIPEVMRSWVWWNNDYGTAAVPAASGTAQLDLAASGSASGDVGTTTGSLSLSGSATWNEPASASLSLNGSAVWSEPASASLSLNGSATWTEPATGSLSLSGSGAAAGSASATGSLTLGGSVAAIASGSGSLSLNGSAVWSEPATASLTLNGSAVWNEPASGALSLNGSAVWTEPASGSLSLSGSAVWSEPAAGSLTLSGSGTAKAPATGSGSITLGGTGNMGGNSGTGSVSLSGSATAAAQATTAGALTLTASGAAQGSAAASALLSLVGTGTLQATATASALVSLQGLGVGGARTGGSGTLTLLAGGQALDNNKLTVDEVDLWVTAAVLPRTLVGQVLTRSATAEALKRTLTAETLTRTQTAAVLTRTIQET